MLILAKSDDFVIYLAAVMICAFIAGVVNRVQKWWAELNKPSSARPPGIPRAPQAKMSGPRRGSAPLPRPVIRESIPGVPAELFKPKGAPPTVRAKAPSPPPRPQGRGDASVPQARKQPSAAPAVPGVDSASAVSPSAIASISDALVQSAQQQSQAAGSAVSSMAAPVTGIGSISREELRRAILLNELLAPPLSLRDEPAAE